jgi:aldose 1-epimerase
LVALRELRSEALAATFAPELGMVAVSLRHGGEELLGQRKGLEAYVERGSTFGIPLLHPWANRLGGFRYAFAGRQVTLAAEDPDVRLEEHGLPVHGLRSAVRGWQLVEASDDRVVAGREVDLPGFPFPHRIETAADLVGPRLSLTTTLTPTSDLPVPVSFGAHPYLRLPGAPRAEWVIRAPVREHLPLGPDAVPTGEREPAGDLDGPLGERTFDDAYTVDPEGGPFALEGGGRRIEVAFERGYPWAQIFAPPNDDVVCFEPMTAPADALRGRLGGPAAAAPGAPYSARFSVTVQPVP